MKKIGDKLKAAREFLGLTQEQVASAVDLTRNTIVNIENNKREVKASELLKFSKLYGISMEEFASEEKEVNMNVPLFARNFEKLSERDQQEIINLIKFKDSYNSQ